MIIVDFVLIIVEFGLVLKLIDISGWCLIFMIFFKFVFLKVWFIFFVVIFFFKLIIKLMSDIFFVGICNVMLCNLFFNFGNIFFKVFVVLVEVGIMFLLYECVCFKFLCGLLIFFWLFVIVWIVVIKLLIILNWLFKIFVIGLM